MNIDQLKALPPMPHLPQPPQVFGRLFVELIDIGALIADHRDYAHDPNYRSAVAARLNFWGDPGRGVHLMPLQQNPKSTEQAMSSKYCYDVLTNESDFMRYLDEMGKLPIKFIDTRRGDRELGNGVVPLKIYIPKGTNRLPVQNKEARLEIRGKYPITDTVNDLREIGNFSFSFNAIFYLDGPTSPPLGNTDSIFMSDSFTQNERRAAEQAAALDDRLPNSLAPTANPADYAHFRPHVGHSEQPIPIHKRPKSRSKNRHKVDFSLPENAHPNTESLLDTLHDPEELERLNFILDRGKRALQKHDKKIAEGESQRASALSFCPQTNVFGEIHKPEVAPKPYSPPARVQGDIAGENQFQIDQVDFDMYDPGIDISASLEPPQPHQKPEKHHLPGREIPTSNQPFINLKDITKLKISIETLSISESKLSKALKIQNAQLSVDCKIPKCSDDGQSMMFNSLKINSQGRVCDDFYEFAVSSSQALSFSERNFQAYTQSKIKLNLEGFANGQLIKLGTAEVPFEKLLLSQGYRVMTSVQIKGDMKRIMGQLTDLDPFSMTPTQGPTKQTQAAKTKGKGKKGKGVKGKPSSKTPVASDFGPQVMSNIVGVLSLHLQLSGSQHTSIRDEYVSEMDSTPMPRPGSQTPLSQSQLPMQPLLLQMYLSIKETKDVQPRFVQILDANLGTQRRNLFVKYKTYPSGDDMMTKIEYNQNQPHFKHQAQSAIFITTDTLIGLKERKLVLEIWDRVTPSRDELVGVVPLQLQPFYHAFRVGDKHTSDGQQVFSSNGVLNSLYPVIGIDDFVPIQDIMKAANVGFLRVTLAMGTTAQVARIQERERRDIEAILSAIQSQPQKIFSVVTPGRVDGHPDSIETLGPKSPHTFGQSPVDFFRDHKKGKHSTNPKEHAIDADDDEERKSPQRSPGKVTAGPSLESRHLSALNLLRKLFENMHHSQIDIPTLLNKQPLLDAESSKLQKLHQGLVDKDQLVEATLSNPTIDITRTDAIRIFDMLLSAIGAPSQYNPDALLDINELILSHDFFETTRRELQNRLKDLFGKVLYLFKKETVSDKMMEDVLRTLREVSAPEGLVTLTEFENALAKYEIVITAGIRDQFVHYLGIDYTKAENASVSPGTLINISPFIHFLRFGSLHTQSFMPISIRVFADDVQREIYQSLELGKLIRADVKDWVAPFVVEGCIMKAIDIQKGLRRLGITLSIFQVACLLEMLNGKYASIYTEPRRFCEIHAKNFALFFGIDVKEAEAAVREDANDEANDIAKWLNVKKGEGVIKSEKEEKRRKNLLKEQGLQEPLPARPLDEPDYYPDAIGEHIDKPSPQKPIRRPPPRIKHVFTVIIDQMLQIPVLHHIVRAVNPAFTAPSQNYLQNVALSFRFPLDPDQIIESDYITIDRSKESRIPQNYKVGLQSCHSIVLDYEGEIENYFKQEQPFPIRLIFKNGSSEQCIGTVQLPGEDLFELIHNFKSKSVNYQKGVAWLKRILFIYGTSYSQRENCIIGKLHLRVNYHIAQVPQPKVKQEKGVKLLAQEESVLLQRETLVNRKVPLQGAFVVRIQRLLGMREALENADFLDKHSTIQRASGSQALYSTRLNELTQLYQKGLNLFVRCSLFEEDRALSLQFLGQKQAGQGVSKFSLNSHISEGVLNPCFDQEFKVKFRMNEALLLYLKDKRALFEVVSEQNGEQEVLGTTWVPLLPVLSHVNGIVGEFELLNSLQQSMGFLRLAINILKADIEDIEQNEDERERLLPVTRVRSATPSKKQPTHSSMSPLVRKHKNPEGDYILGLQFSELLMPEEDMAPLYKIRTMYGTEADFNDRSFTAAPPKGPCKLLYLRYSILGKNYQSKFMPQYVENIPTVGLNFLPLNKTTLIPICFPSQDMEQALSKPLEIQLWSRTDPLARKTALSATEIVKQEQLIGSFFIELRDLFSKQLIPQAEDNDQLEVVNSSSYFSMFNFRENKLAPTRLGLKLYVFKKECQSHISDLENLFLSLPRGIQLDQSSICLLQKYEAILGTGKLAYEMESVIHVNKQESDPSFYVREERVRERKKEFQLHDDYDSGFLKKKAFQRIIDSPQDGIITNLDLKPNPTDVHYNAHGLKISVDYIVFLRFIASWIRADPIQEEFTLRGAQLSTPKDRALESLQGNSEKAIYEKSEEVVQLKIQVNGAYGLSHPLDRASRPTAFVKITNPFAPTEVLETHAVINSVNPKWSQIHHQSFKIPLSKLTVLREQGFVAQVFHKATFAGTRDQFLQEKDILIGESKIDLTGLFLKENIFGEQPSMDGFYHIVHHGKQGSQGQLNVTVLSLNPDIGRQVKKQSELLREDERDRGLDRVYSTLRETNLKEIWQWRRDEPLERNAPYSLFEKSHIEQPREDASVKDIFASLNDLTSTLQAKIGKSGSQAEVDREERADELNDEGGFYEIQQEETKEQDQIPQKQEKKEEELPLRNQMLHSFGKEDPTYIGTSGAQPTNIFLQNLASMDQTPYHAEGRQRGRDFSNVSPEEYERIERIMNPKRYDSDQE